jgi:EmrB/QacA subfamily drug resistance transporter
LTEPALDTLEDEPMTTERHRRIEPRCATPRGWSAQAGHERRWTILVVLAAVAFMAQLDLFIVNIAIPAMGRSFAGSGLSGLSWVLNAYAIVFAALLVPAGRLADHFGRRRFLLAGVLVFTASSALCAVAPTLEVLIAGRALQAVGAAAIVPTSLGLLLPVFPARQHNLAVGIWAGVAAVAASSGPALGGLLVAVDWRWIFLVNVPIGLFTLVLGLRVLPEIKADAGARLPDPVSVLSLLAAVTLAIFGLVQGPTWGWRSVAVIGLLLVAALAAVVTLMRTLHHPHAVIEASLFQSREFASAAVGLFLFFIAFAAWLLITVLFLQDMWHYSALRTGLAMAPGPMTAAVFAINSGRITGRFGRTGPAATGALLTGASAVYWLAAAPSHPSYLISFLPGLILAGAGSGLVQAPLFAAATTLAPDRATTGSAVLNMARQVGSAVGVAGLVALLATEHPARLALFHRGWILEIAACGAAALSITVPRARAAKPAPESSVLPAPESSVLRAPESSVLRAPESSVLRAPESSVLPAPTSATAAAQRG